MLKNNISNNHQQSSQSEFINFLHEHWSIGFLLIKLLKDLFGGTVLVFKYKEESNCTVADKTSVTSESHKVPTT